MIYLISELLSSTQPLALEEWKSPRDCQDDDFDSDRDSNMKQRFSLWPIFWFLTFCPLYFLLSPHSILTTRKKIRQSHKWGPLTKPELFNLSSLLPFMHMLTPYYTDHGTWLILFYINIHRFPTLLCTRTMTSLHEFHEKKGNTLAWLFKFHIFTPETRLFLAKFLIRIPD